MLPKILYCYRMDVQVGVVAEDLQYHICQCASCYHVAPPVGWYSGQGILPAH